MDSTAIRSRLARHRLRVLGWSGAHLMADARAFLQERLRLYLRLIAFVTSGFYTLGALATIALGVGRAALIGSLPYLALILSFWGLAALLRKRPMPLSTLRAIEGISILAVSLGFSRLFYELKPTRDLGDSALIIIVGLMSVGRAALVPTLTARLVATCLISFAPVVWMLYSLYADAPDVAHPWAGPIPQPIASVAFGLAWASAFTFVSVVIAKVVYGLQAEVRDRERLGQYTLIERLGEGGMGVVYRASHAMLRRPTAVKLLPPEKIGEASLARFEHEVQQTALLTHPNTITIYDYGRTPDGIFYYAMEYLDGVDLERLIERHGPQPPARVVHVLRQVASALVEAHAHGLIHRDVKPANVYLCRYGGARDVAKVLDFGLVKDTTSEGNVALSQANSVTGTPLYMAPEAVGGSEGIDGRADLYALAAVGYYLLCGEHVFDGGNLVEVLGHHLHSTPVPPSERLGEPGVIPEALERFILRGLAKSPAERPRDARAFVEELDALGLPGWSEGDAESWWGSRDDAAARVAKPLTSSRADTVTLEVALPRP